MLDLDKCVVMHCMPSGHPSRTVAGVQPSTMHCIDRWGSLPLGRAKTPSSEPLARARLKREVNCASLTLPSWLLASTYFLRAWRLLGERPC